MLWLNQPELVNALSPQIKYGLAEYIPEFFQDPSARCLLMSGNGKSFCAGGDLRDMAGEQSPLVVRKRLSDSHENWVRHLLFGEKPVVMAVNGAAIGAGFALAMLGDIIIAANTAYFQAGFSSIGVVADMGLSATLPRAVGMPRAKAILFGNERVSAAEALSIGMVNGITESNLLMPSAIELAEKLASGPTTAIGLTKKLLNVGFDETGLNFRKTEAEVQAVAFSSKDRAEGVAAFFEKRKPNFIGH